MKPLSRISLFLLLGITLFSCATTPPPAEVGGASRETPPERQVAASMAESVETAVKSGESGILDLDVTDVLGNSLPTRVEMVRFDDGAMVAVNAPSGSTEQRVPVGNYRAYVYVYEQDIPYLVEIEDIRVFREESTFLLVNLLEGSSDILSLGSFDSDGDLAIDRVELAAGTDPYDAASVPGKRTLPYDAQVMGGGAGWYAGELYAQSNYGVGTENVAQLIRRAERAGMDFLAITDENTMESIYDAGYQSNRLVLLPAMKWGNQDKGWAFIYGPRTLPDPPTTYWAGQAECIRVQAQGGVFAVAHPTLAAAPWLWGLSYVNAVQVWWRGWREIPPLALEQLPQEYHKTDERGMLVYALSRAAASSERASTSANAQAERFWSHEMDMGLMASAIGGSGSGSAKVPIGRPVTYVYAQEKSLPGIMEGLRLGRTFVTRDVNGPKLEFFADVLANKKVDVGMGGVVPQGVVVEFEARVANAAGKKLQILRNGRPIITKVIEGEGFIHRFRDTPKAYSIYRVRVVGPPPEREQGFGPLEVFALSSPIYAQDITRELVWRHPELNLQDTWIRATPDPRDDVSIVDQLPEHDQPLPLQRMY